MNNRFQNGTGADAEGLLALGERAISSFGLLLLTIDYKDFIRSTAIGSPTFSWYFSRIGPGRAFSQTLKGKQ